MAFFQFDPKDALANGVISDQVDRYSMAERYRKRFLKYLFHKSMTVDVWDADSKMLFGSFKVPLRDLLR